MSARHRRRAAGEDIREDGGALHVHQGRLSEELVDKLAVELAPARSGRDGGVKRRDAALRGAREVDLTAVLDLDEADYIIACGAAARRGISAAATTASMSPCH